MKPSYQHSLQKVLLNTTVETADLPEIPPLAANACGEGAGWECPICKRSRSRYVDVVIGGMRRAAILAADVERRIRRRDLFAAAGGLAAGAAAAGIPLALTSGPVSAQPTPGEDLMSEHGLLVRILLIYRNQATRFQSSGQVDAGHLHDAALIIHDYIEGFHEILEEEFVFAKLLAAGQLTSTIMTLLTQHGRGREVTELILVKAAGGGVVRGDTAATLAQAIGLFVTMYEPHEAREDTVIYPAYRSLLSPADIASLSDRFASLQSEQFGANAFAEMVGRVVTIEQALGIYDLTQFTPPQVSS
jgi:hemerythrin-like domain-containing protein